MVGCCCDPQRGRSEAGLSGLPVMGRVRCLIVNGGIKCIMKGGRFSGRVLVVVRSARVTRGLLVRGGSWSHAEGKGDAQALEVNSDGLDLNLVAQL